MHRRTFMAAVSALLSNVYPAQVKSAIASEGGQQAAMRAAWESLTWASSTGKALVVDVGLPWRLISWEKAQYLPCWEVQKDLWFFSEFLETAGTAALERGSHEPLSDKYNRYTHVSITELGPARIVLHWQYALSDSTEKANIFHGNTWAEEFHTIYPDGLTVRKVTGFPGNENRNQGQPVVWEVAELDLVFAPGARLKETINPSSALRISGGSQDPYILSWPSTGERWLCQRNPASCDWPAYLFRPSLRTQPEPFLIVPNRKDYFPRIACGACGGDHLAAMLWLEPGVYKNWPGCSGACPKIVKGTEEDMKAQAVHMPFVSVIPWVHPSFLTNFLSQRDRASASGVSYDPNWGPKPGTSWLMLFGTSQESDRYLSDVAGQWVKPSELEMREGESQGFEASENLYKIAPSRKGCTFEISRADRRPLVHPTFKILNWGYRSARVSLNGALLTPERWRGSWVNGDLIVWVNEVLTKPCEISIQTF